MKRISWYPLAFFVALSTALSGCNEGEDFGNAVIGGPVIDGTNQPAPLPSEIEDAVEIELVVGKMDGGKFHSANVAHLKYKCTGEVGSIPSTGDKKYLARCATTASQVEFFIGESNSLPSERISLGTAYLPLCSGRSGGSAGATGCAGGSGFFQVTLADLVPYSPPPPGDPAALSAPARRSASDVEVRNRAALLDALDVSSNKLVLEVASAASNLAGNAPLTNFKESDYNDFKTYWSAWLAQVSTSQGGTPLAMQGVAADVEQMTQAAMNRTRMGLFSLERTSSLYSLDPDENTLNLEITVPFIVMPGGGVAGVGALFTTIGTGVNTKPATDLLAIKSGAQLDESLRIGGEAGAEHWQVDGVLGEQGNTSVKTDLQFRGRIIGSSAYDNKAPQGSPGRTDYKLDYPDIGLYVMKPDDQARFAGFASTDNNSLSEKPYRIGRSSFVSAVLHDSVLNKLKGFYQVTIYKACVGSEADSPGDLACKPIDAAEIGAGLNYPTAFAAACPTNEPLCDANVGKEIQVTKEKPRAGTFDNYAYAYADGSFNLQILADGSIVTDRAKTCQPLDAGTELKRNGLKEYQVGYVSRTWPSDDGTTDSANVLVFMASSAAAAPAGENASDPGTGEFMPHFGTQIQGRINLSNATPEKPLYRLGDDNFADGIRAYWQDFYQFGKYTNDKTNDDIRGDVGHQAQALAGGAAEGVALDEITCLPVP